MRVQRNLLPESPEGWHGFLRDYFCDKDAIATLEGDYVQLSLEWPSGIERHVDPELQSGLDWWGRGVSRATMWSAAYRDGPILTSLYDTWTLHSWSEWLARTPVQRVKDVVLLHVDDHRDLGSPRLLVRDGALVDAITGELFNLCHPESVRSAINSGAIGMGSFMTPFIHEFPAAQVRHLCQPPKGHRTTASRLLPITVADTLLDLGSERPAIDYLPDYAVSQGSYLVTPDASIWAKGIEGRPALVHIDMDYFNNRYDGDSLWQERKEQLDPDLSSIFVKIDELLDALAMSGVEIDDVTIAYSPGFFPAEYWQIADQRLRTGLHKILG